MKCQGIEMNWQKIETAPKDGREIVLWCENIKLLIPVATWERDRWYEVFIDDNADETWRIIDPQAQPSHWLEIIPPN
jgi:hypothetical protein